LLASFLSGYLWVCLIIKPVSNDVPEQAGLSDMDLIKRFIYKMTGNMINLL